jgi:hypothetical protein
VERCLACEADSVGAVDRCLVARLGQTSAVFQQVAKPRPRKRGSAPQMNRQ